MLSLTNPSCCKNGKRRVIGRLGSSGRENNNKRKYSLVVKALFYGCILSIGVLCYYSIPLKKITTTTTTILSSNAKNGNNNIHTNNGDNAVVVGTSSSSLAYQHSFGLLDDVSDTVWEGIRNKTKSTSWYANPENPLEGVDDAIRWNEHNMIPNFECPNLDKVGVSEGSEGTKLVCHPKRLNSNDGGCLIYSIGCAGSFKFEDALYKMHGGKCEIHIFDPADWTRKGDDVRKNIHYHPWGIVSTYDKTSKSVVWPKGRRGGFKTFPDTLKLLGHENRIIDLFKIDCEGCEWSSLEDWIGLGFRQILIEMHGVPNLKGTPKLRWYKKPMNVANYYNTFRKHGYALYSRDMVGLAMELSFIKLQTDFWD